MRWLRNGISFLYSYSRIRLRENEKEVPKYALEGALFGCHFGTFGVSCGLLGPKRVLKRALEGP